MRESGGKKSIITIGVFIAIGFIIMALIFPVNVFESNNPETILEGFAKIFIAIFEALGVVLLYGLVSGIILDSLLCLIFSIKNFRININKVKILYGVYIFLSLGLMALAIAKIIILATN